MKQRTGFLWIYIILMVIFSACKSDLDKSAIDFPIKVEWEILSNTEWEDPAALMNFKIVNNSNIELTDKNWSLFFNQPPRSVIETADTTIASVTRIKGDWYKLQLAAETKIAPGDSFELNYALSHWIIKETDAPQGVYSTLFNSDGDIIQHIPTKDYTILAFSKKEQINRHRNDNIPIPTAAWQYQYNNSIFTSNSEELLPIIPQPKNLTINNEFLVLTNEYAIVAPQSLHNETTYIAKMLSRLTGTTFTTTTEIAQHEKQITLSIDESIGNTEGYKLNVNEAKIAIAGGSSTGVFYGIQSLLNTIDYSYYKNPNAEIKIPSMEINDEPRFAYRGLHLDVCRNFQKKEEIIRILDIMALYKLNKLHFYITEDEGWRIEIKSIPELTEYGSKRGHTLSENMHLMPAYGSGPFADDANSYGSGYYSREDYIEIIQHAHSKHIDVIPSINFPGHARSAVQSMEYRYRKYIAAGDSANAMKYRLIDPQDESKYSSVQGYTDNVVDVGLESTYTFFETVVDDVIELYKEAKVPLTTIHTGGDEVPNGVWTASPASEKLLESQIDIHDPKNLQAYFFKRVNDILYSRNLITAGWEEIALTRTPEGEHIVNADFTNKKVVPYVWNNFGHAIDLTHKLANAGYPVVFCGVTNLYFDMAYNKDPKEPGYYWGGFVNERKVWELSPFNLIETTTTDNMGHTVNLENKVDLTSEGKENIIGLQAELWSETVKGPDMLEYYILPKIISFSEKAWAQAPKWESMPVDANRNIEMNKVWVPFINTIANKELLRLNYLNNGYNYRVPTPGAIIKDNLLYVNHEYPGMKVYYTTDNTEPTIESDAFTKPIEYSSPILLKAIDKEGKESRSIEISEK